MGTVVLFSGGVDSTTLLYHLLQFHEPSKIAALGFDYSQAHRYQELLAASRIAAELGVDFYRVPINPAVFGQPAVISVGEGDPVVPGRNVVFLAMAGAWAAARGMDTVAIGAHKDDAGLFPDCREDFLAAMDAALGTYGVSVYAPFLLHSKAEIVALGRGLSVPYERTWSCYWSGEQHCGHCLACTERARVLV